MRLNIIEENKTGFKPNLSFFGEVPSFIENEIDDFIVKKLNLKDQVKSESMTSYEIINLLIREICDDKRHIHTIKCVYVAEAFDASNDCCRWDINLFDLNKFFSIRVSESSLCNLLNNFSYDIKLNNNKICIIQGNILGYLLNKMNKTSLCYLTNHSIQADSLHYEINLLSPFMYLDDSCGDLHADKINEFSKLQNSFRSVSHLSIEKILARVLELPSSIMKCLIDDCEFWLTDKTISFSIIKDSRIDYSLNSFYSDNPLSNQLDLFVPLGLYGNEVHSSNLTLFTPWKTNIPYSTFYIDNCNFYNSFIAICPTKVARIHTSPIEFIFRNCYLNNTIINNFTNKNNVSIQFENCIFNYSNTKFEIEKMI